MANKKYTDFPSGTYDTSKIFLQADAITGALEQVNLPSIPAASLKNYISLATTGNTGGINTVIQSIVIPANTLVSNGDILKILMSFGVVSTASKTYTLNFGATNLQTIVSGFNSNGIFETILMRVSSTVLRVSSRCVIGTGIRGNSYIEQSGQDFTVSRNIEVAVNTAASNDVLAQFGSVLYIPVTP